MSTSSRTNPSASDLAGRQARSQKPGKTALFGYPISLSLAPTFHNACYRQRHVPWTCELLESQDFNDFLRFIREDDFIGSAVTMPYKSEVLKHVDEIDQEAELIGAANTVYWRDHEDGKRSLVATNTDVAGIADAIISALPDSSRVEATTDRRIGLIVGGGGTTRTAVYTLRFRLKCDEIYIINRMDEEVGAVVQDFQAKGVEGVMQLKTPKDAAALGRTPDVIVNAIPSHDPQTEGEKLARQTLEAVLSLPAHSSLSSAPVFLEMCYHPHPWTKISSIAEEQGWHVIQGMECMYHQAVAQQMLWLPPTTTASESKELLKAGKEAVLQVLESRGALTKPKCA
ncbi:Aminoacid dehydrogenase-like protein [Tilletiaria anomala UBC 951]|uniref:Aminoacid dehydrogenase-like protein n=1 Tax=Tilletiaria anomala (strain ATCC 24038 / CBS 436.72 / UBC 951) TaxID=1037660 RepID=A0A066VU01_TILAU|nr:Aminoacid dehydrogenase-like protein [Tilletiaria anomala UBC 951]KDN44941.1 Aminoacid dehydrogenase-like protein [Tilletiaria anomala UBC 951]